MPSRTIKRQRRGRTRQVPAFAFSEITPLGDSALIIRIAREFESDPERCLRDAADVMQRVENAGLPGIVEVAPAFTSVSVFYDPSLIAAAGIPVDEIFTWLAGRLNALLGAPRARPSKPNRARAIDIPICYDSTFAPDLARVSDHAGISTEEVIAAHAAARYRVASVGFSPGFPYLAGLPPALATPRRGRPRTKIAAGSVAIGGTQAGIYPSESPGGWNVIGRTPLPLFDVTRDPPSLLTMGDAVRFRPITRAEFEASVAAVSDRRGVGAAANSSQKKEPPRK